MPLQTKENDFSTCLEPSEYCYVFPPHSTLRYQNALHKRTRKTKRLIINYHSTAETILGLFFVAYYCNFQHNDCLLKYA